MAVSPGHDEPARPAATQEEQPPTLDRPPEPPEAKPAYADTSLGGARAWFRERAITRARTPRLLGGVCSGLARRYDVNLLVVRLTFIATALIGPGIVAYVALWILVPQDG